MLVLNGSTGIDFPDGAPLPVNSGGTGLETITANGVVIGNGTSALQTVAPGASGNILTSTGTSWASVAAPIIPPADKTWTFYTSSNTYTVPSGVTSIRAYAVGKGGNGASVKGSTFKACGGGGGGFAFGDISVTPGSTVTISISAGIATLTYGGTTLLTANPGTDGTSSVGGTGGTATKHASVTNGGAYSGGNGGQGNEVGAAYGGGSAGSPLGNGITNPTNGAGGGAGIGGAGDSAGGGAGGAANGANPGGAGGAASDITGKGRTFDQLFSDPLLRHAIFPGVRSDSGYPIHGLPGAGGSDTGLVLGANGGDFGGGGRVNTASTTSSPAIAGNGGILAGGGACERSDSSATGSSIGGNGGLGGGGGGAWHTRDASTATGGTGGSAAVIIYA